MNDCGILMGNELQLAVPFGDNLLKFLKADAEVNFVAKFLVFNKHTVEGFFRKTTISSLQEDLRVAERIAVDRNDDCIASTW